MQARFTVDSYTRPVKAVLQLPSKPPGYVILDENFVSRGFGLAVVEEGIWREAQWAIREAAGRQTFYYRAVVTPDASIQDADAPGPITVETSSEAVCDRYRDDRRAGSGPVCRCHELYYRGLAPHQ